MTRVIKLWSEIMAKKTWNVSVSVSERLKRRHFCCVWWQSSCVLWFVEVFIVWKVSHTNLVNKVTATSAKKSRGKNRQPQWQTIFEGCAFFPRTNFVHCLIYERFGMVKWLSVKSSKLNFQFHQKQKHTNISFRFPENSSQTIWTSSTQTYVHKHTNMVG